MTEADEIIYIVSREDQGSSAKTDWQEIQWLEKVVFHTGHNFFIGEVFCS